MLSWKGLVFTTKQYGLQLFDKYKKLWNPISLTSATVPGLHVDRGIGLSYSKEVLKASKFDIQSRVKGIADISLVRRNIEKEQRAHISLNGFQFHTDAPDQDFRIRTVLNNNLELYENNYVVKVGNAKAEAYEFESVIQTLL